MLDKTSLWKWTNCTNHPQTYFCKIFHNWKAKKWIFMLTLDLYEADRGGQEMSSGWDSKIPVFITKVTHVSCDKIDFLVTVSTFWREGNSDLSDTCFFFNLAVPDHGHSLWEKKWTTICWRSSNINEKWAKTKLNCYLIYFCWFSLLILVGWFCCYCFVLSIWNSKWWMSLFILLRTKP